MITACAIHAPAILHQPAPSQSGRIFALFNNGFGRLPPGAVTLLAGDHPAVVNDAIEQLMRLDVSVKDRHLHKLVPMVDREDTKGIGDLQFLLGPPRRRVCARVLSKGGPALEHVKAVASFVIECLDAWAYDSANRPTVVIVELDDFYECAGVRHLGPLLERLNEVARRFDVALLAIANRAGSAMAATTTDHALVPEATVREAAPVEEDISSKTTREMEPCLSSDEEEPSETSSVRKRTRDPHARDMILRELAKAPSTPAQLAARMSRGVASKQQRDNVRQHLHNMKRDGAVVCVEGRYRVAATTSTPAASN